jgi:hypothetical protein
MEQRLSPLRSTKTYRAKGISGTVRARHKTASNHYFPETDEMTMFHTFDNSTRAVSPKMISLTRKLDRSRTGRVRTILSPRRKQGFRLFNVYDSEFPMLNHGQL